MEYRTPRITKDKKDPFGKAMKAYLRGQLDATVTVYSDLAINDNIPVSYLFRSYSQMPTWEKKALDFCKGNILDIGAGAGSHSLELQNRGFSVKSIDISSGAVDIMKIRGLKDVEHVSFWEYPSEKFDTLLLLMNGIGLVGDLKGLNAFLEKAKSMLTPEGQIILDSSDIKYLYNDLELSPPNDIYYGLITYQMAFKTAVSEKFSWLYIDFARLLKHTRHFGLTCELLYEGPHFEYLARIYVE